MASLEIRAIFAPACHRFADRLNIPSVAFLISESDVTIQVNITPQGRMSLPADLRKRLGLVRGGAVFLEETEDGIVIRTAAQAVAHAQAIAKRFADGRADLSVSGFLSHRRADSVE